MTFPTDSCLSLKQHPLLLHPESLEGILVAVEMGAGLGYGVRVQPQMARTGNSDVIVLPQYRQMSSFLSVQKSVDI